MIKPNFVLVTMDEVRPDHLSCYGYETIRTSNLDTIAQGGVIFEDAFSASCFTPVAHASILTGLYPYNHGLRSAYDCIETKSLSHFLRESGYQTAAFVGVDLIGTANGFDSGFDCFDEPQDMRAWRVTTYEENRVVLWGNDHIDRMLKWIEMNGSAPFFLWVHYFDCHEGAEKHLLEQGKLRKGALEEYSYYDAKIQFMDSFLFGQLLELLEKLAIDENTYVVVTSDHGTNLGDHPLPRNDSLGITYPQHLTLHDCDLRVPLIIAGNGIPKKKRVRGIVRSVDIAPTILDLAGLEVDGLNGVSLLPIMRMEKAEDLEVYAEDLFSSRGPGDYQAIRDDKYKFIIDRRTGNEALYDLLLFPDENQPLNTLSDNEKQLLQKWRRICDDTRPAWQGNTTNRDMRIVEERLRALGYI